MSFNIDVPDDIEDASDDEIDAAADPLANQQVTKIDPATIAVTAECECGRRIETDVAEMLLTGAECPHCESLVVFYVEQEDAEMGGVR